MEAISDKARSLFEDALKDKKKLIKIMSVIIILLLALILRLHGSSKPDISVENTESYSTATEDGSDESSEDEEKYVSLDNLYVDISGAVNNPGVYSVSSKTRLYEVVEMAGGLTERADINSINQASFVEDGEKIIIPEKGEIAVGEELGTSAAAPSSATAGLVNINFASKDDLKTLNGIGDAIADRIIDYRNTTKFKNIEDIKNVKGIGDGVFEKIKDDITC